MSSVYSESIYHIELSYEINILTLYQKLVQHTTVVYTACIPSIIYMLHTLCNSKIVPSTLYGTFYTLLRRFFVFHTVKNGYRFVQFTPLLRHVEAGTLPREALWEPGEKLFTP